MDFFLHEFSTRHERKKRREILIFLWLFRFVSIFFLSFSYYYSTLQYMYTIQYIYILPLVITWTFYYPVFVFPFYTLIYVYLCIFTPYYTVHASISFTSTPYIITFSVFPSYLFLAFVLSLIFVRLNLNFSRLVVEDTFIY